VMGKTTKSMRQCPGRKERKTMKIDGLTESDFIFAAKVDQMERP
jgi:hypothetical protein